MELIILSMIPIFELFCIANIMHIICLGWGLNRQINTAQVTIRKDVDYSRRKEDEQSINLFATKGAAA